MSCAEAELMLFKYEADADIKDPVLADHLDNNDPYACVLKREQFFMPKFCHLPQLRNLCDRQEEECIYLTSHSLGLQPRRSQNELQTIMTQWGTLGSIAHDSTDQPINACDLVPVPLMAQLVGCQENEVIVMNSLSVNFHLLMQCFYEPDGDRCKIIHEDNIFPSEKFAIDNHARIHNYNPEDVCIAGGSTTDSILRTISEFSNSISVIFIGAVHYLTGYRFHINRIVEFGHAVGAKVGFCLAHGVGTIPLELHNDNVDFAVWCTYKYLCAGFCSASGVFIHERFLNQGFKNRMDGWWAGTKRSRLVPTMDLEREQGILGFRVSHPNPFQCVPITTYLQLMIESGLEKYYARGWLLTEYLYKLLKAQFPDIQMLTPEQSKLRGFHVAFYSPTGHDACQLEQAMLDQGVMIDRRGDVIRASVHPLYTKFSELHRFISIIAGLQC